MKNLALALVAAVAGPVSGEMASPETIVETSNAGWESAFNTGDTTALSRLYAADATLIAPSLEIVSERVEIEKFWAAKFGAGVRDFRLDRINLRADGDRVYQSAAWSASVNTAGRSHAIDGEMTSVIERQSDGTWQIRLQNWY
ncbi:MAG TPA: DUF4440 domain-containing protein [Gammaproteobacteria bacterium]|jgi:uncharacterized protein (TIGR02246 family)